MQSGNLFRTVIPAGAGNTRLRNSTWNGTRGSSPLVRGTRETKVGYYLYRRFIPAGAGNTMTRAAASSPPAVHPRWRGEHPFSASDSLSSSGSSPLARGTLRCLTGGPFGGRFIPAGAGNTTLTVVANSGCSVHPRWRGEHQIRSWCSLNTNGSSPLARGTRRQGEHMLALGRFIPAGAGNTRHSGTHRDRRAVHPRWRGEHLHSRPGLPGNTGSSPLARGTLPAPAPRVEKRRFIPAGAGNTPT